MFGSQSGSDARDEAPDEWEFGDDVGLDDTTVKEDQDLRSYDSGGGRRWSFLVGIAAVLIAGAVAYVWLFQRDVVEGWFGSLDKEGAVDISKQKSTESDPKSDDTVADLDEVTTSLNEAIDSARQEVEEKEAELFAEVHEVADEALFASVESAGEEAKESGAGGSVESTLAEAHNALERGRANEARRLFHKVIDRDGQNSDAITGLGWALLNLGRADSAAAQFKKALHHNPSFGDAYIGLGHANRELGRPKKALDAYQDYLDRFPGGSKASIARYQAKQLKESLGMN